MDKSKPEGGPRWFCSKVSSNKPCFHPGRVLWKSTQCNFELLSHLLGAVPEEFYPTYLQPTLAGFLLKTTWNRKCLCSLYP